MSFKALCLLASIAEQVQVTVLKAPDDQFMTVIAPSLALAKKYPQLASPLMVTATAADMDTELDKAITAYQTVLATASSNLNEIEAKIKAEADDAAAKLKAKQASKVAGKAAGNGTTTSVTKPAAPMTAGPKAVEKPPALDLFNLGAEGSPPTAPATLEDGADDTDTDGDSDLPPLGDD